MREAGRADARFAPELLVAAQGGAQGIRAALFDVDGVLTDGRIYVGEHGEAFKAFSTLDGQGLKLLAAGGIEPVVVTGRDSAAVRRRVAALAGESPVECRRQVVRNSGSPSRHR